MRPQEKAAGVLDTPATADRKQCPSNVFTAENLSNHDKRFVTLRALPNDGVILINGADLTPEPVCWLWTYWLAVGKLHILAGAPGQGKTTLALTTAATVTIGGHWPDGSRCEPGVGAGVNPPLFAGEEAVLLGGPG